MSPWKVFDVRDRPPLDDSNAARSLGLYAHLDRLGWPRTFGGKVFLVAFLSTHIPLLALIGFLLWRRGEVSLLAVALVTLLATGAGAALSLWALGQLLAPMLLAAGALECYLTDGRVTPLPTRHSDEAGLLLRNVGLAMQTFHGERRHLVQEARSDALTGLLNRRGAERQLRRTLLQHARDDRSRCVALVDVDHFKRVNDTWGHAAGDALLTELGHRFRTGVHAGDCAARLGGDEFLLLLEGTPAEALATVERLRVDAQTGYETPEREGGATLSIGVAPLQAGNDVLRCLHRADLALYQAKHGGRNRAVLAEPDGSGGD